MSAELVAWEADDLKVVRVLALYLLVQLLKAFKLGCEAAFRRRVDDEDDFTVELVEVVGSALLCIRSQRLFGTAVRSMVCLYLARI